MHHLLSGVENQASLCDALAFLKMFPQRFTRTEALFIRLSHIATLAEAGTSFEVLRHDSLLALSTAPITERMVAVWYFACDCSNLLGDWACAIDVCESQDRACRRKELSPVAAWKTCSSTLCTLVTEILQDALLETHTSCSDTQVMALKAQWTQWLSGDVLDTLTRSKHLQACSAGGGRAFIQVLRLGNLWSVGHVGHLQVHCAGGLDGGPSSTVALDNLRALPGALS